MRRLYTYKNGNYVVAIFDDGTKIRYNHEDKLIPAFAESIDLKITNSCRGFVCADGVRRNCSHCHECSYPGGKHADLSNPLFDSLHQGQEIAVGGGSVSEHPDLVPFLRRMKQKGIVCNMTTHWRHFVEDYEFICNLQEEELIYGVGISVNEIIPDDVITLIAGLPNSVVHVIAGVVPWEALKKMANHGLRLLILGYKDFGRGKDYLKVEGNEIMLGIAKLHENMDYLMKHYKVLSFDNLAIQQLKIREFVSEEDWKEKFMGFDAQYTFYIDAVARTFAKSSTSERLPINSDNVDDLFNQIRI